MPASLALIRRGKDMVPIALLLAAFLVVLYWQTRPTLSFVQIGDVYWLDASKFESNQGKIVAYGGAQWYQVEYADRRGYAWINLAQLPYLQKVEPMRMKRFED